MADIVDASTLSPAQDETLPLVAQPEEKVSRLWERIALAAVLLVSVFMNFFQLGQSSYGNLYYAAGVRSMLDSLHNFFFVAYDPGGFVSVDKPPLGFWLQTLSARVFGFTPFSIFLPQAVCGVLAVLLLYLLVRRHFGVAAGLVAALALAVTPISVVTNRNNTIDSTLALFLLLAAWAIIRAAESGKLRWLLLSALFVGLGFNIKMSEAYLALPALFMTYLLCAPRKWWTRAWHLALFVVVVLALSLSWIAIVDLTPASERPYVGSTQNNSALSLATGYNGLNRLRIPSNDIGFAPRPTQDTTERARSSSTDTSAPAATNSGTGGNSRGTSSQTFQRGQIFSEAGTPGVLRLVGPSLGGQIGWLMPLAVLGIIALAWQRRPNFQRDRQQLGLVLWGFWLVTMAAFFSLDSSFHQYYLTELSPGLSALAGIGLIVMWRDYRAGGWRGWLLLLALAVTGGVQIRMLSKYPTWASWLSPLIGVLVGLTILTLLVLLALRLRSRWRSNRVLARTGALVLGLGMLSLLSAPATWSGYSVLRNSESSAPTAGPALQVDTAGRPVPTVPTVPTRATNGSSNTRVGQGAAFLDPNLVNPGLISYLQAHQGNTKYLLATINSGSASPIILATNKPVMALGGFSGNDPILTVKQLQTLIKNGTVRYFLLTTPRVTQDLFARLSSQFRNLARGRGGSGQNAVLTSWVASHCVVVPTSNLQAAGKTSSLGSNHLYDCAPAA